MNADTLRKEIADLSAERSQRIATLEAQLAALTAENAALRANSAEATELLREIRDGEVNAEDEADKFLRDPAPSRLSEVTAERDALDAEQNLALDYITALTAERDAALRKLVVARPSLPARTGGGDGRDAEKETHRW